MTPTDGLEGAATGIRKQRAVGETEQLVSVLGALLTECERVRAMGEAAAGRLRHMINDLEARSQRDHGASSDGPDGSAGDSTRKEARSQASEKSGGVPSSSLQGIRLEKSAPKPSRPAVKHGLVVGAAVAFATLWALGIVAEVPQRQMSAPNLPEETAEIREPKPSGQAPTIPETPARITGKAPQPAGPPATGATVKPDADLPPITAGFTGRGIFSRSGHARASDEAIQPRPESDLKPAEASPALSRPGEPSARRGPSPETP